MDILYIDFKVFNNLIRLNDLVPTFLIFGTYFYMININIFLSNMTQYNIVMQKVMEKVKKFYAIYYINNI